MKTLRLLIVVTLSVFLLIGLTLTQSGAAPAPAEFVPPPGYVVNDSPITVQPAALILLTEVATPTIQTRTLNLTVAAASLAITWSISIETSSPITLAVAPLTGTHTATLTVSIDPGAITTTGTYTANLIVTAGPITIPIAVHAVEQLQRSYLPIVSSNYAAPLPPVPPAPSTLQLGLAFVSSAESPASDDRYQHTVTLSATVNRWPMYWPSIETDPLNQPRVFDWSRQDANISADLDHGLTTLPILMLTPIGLDTAGSRTAPQPKVGDGLRQRLSGQSSNRITAPSSQGSPPHGLYLPVFTDNTDWPGAGQTINPDNRWAYFVNAAVTRFKPGGVLAQARGWTNDQGIRYWEIWNEEDLNQFFIGTPTDYARLLKVAYLAAKQADPAAIVVLGGLAHFEKPNWLADVLNVIATDPMSNTYHGFMEAVASHNYSWAWQTFGYLYQDRQRLDARGFTNVKLWITETGLPVCEDSPIEPFNFCPSRYRGTLSEQVDFLLQTTAWSAWMNAEKMIWFQLYDDVGNVCPYDFFGLVRNPAGGPCVPNTGAPRPAYNAYRLAAQLFGNAQPDWRSRPTANQEIIAFKRPATNERVVVMWTRFATAATVTLTATSSSATLIRPDGTAQIITPVNGVYVIDLPAATNFSSDTNDGSAAIGGSPRIVVEYDPAATP